MSDKRNGKKRYGCECKLFGFIGFLPHRIVCLSQLQMLFHHKMSGAAKPKERDRVRRELKAQKKKKNFYDVACIISMPFSNESLRDFYSKLWQHYGASTLNHSSAFIWMGKYDYSVVFCVWLRHQTSSIFLTVVALANDITETACTLQHNVLFYTRWHISFVTGWHTATPPIRKHYFIWQRCSNRTTFGATTSPTTHNNRHTEGAKRSKPTIHVRLWRRWTTTGTNLFPPLVQMA